MSTDDRQLSDLTGETDPLHPERIPPLPDEAGEALAGTGGGSFGAGRRQFLAKLGVGAAAVGIGSLAPVGHLVPDAWAQAGTPLDDGSILKYAMTLEYAAVDTYGRAIATGKLSAGRAAQATTFSGHHSDHGDGFATAITAADADKVPNGKVVAVFSPRITAAADENAVLEVLFSLEEALAATYLLMCGQFASKQNAGVAATVLPVESQHAVVLAQALAKPISQSVPPFETQKAALDPATYAS